VLTLPSVYAGDFVDGSALLKCVTSYVDAGSTENVRNPFHIVMADCPRRLHCKVAVKVTLRRLLAALQTPCLCCC